MLGDSPSQLIDQVSQDITSRRHFSEEELILYLKNKRSMPSEVTSEYRDHLNHCTPCWNSWNKVRWDASMHSRGVAELHAYLGNTFKEYFDSSWAIAEEWLLSNPHTKEEVAHFYKTTTSYLYNLVVWYESGDRDLFDTHIQKLKKRFGVHSVMDYGCGVGNDGLMMLENGFEVQFVDYVCPSIDFLRWRMKTRRLTGTILDVEKIDRLPDVDMFWAIDVLEHMKDPAWVVDNLSPQTKVFAHRSEFGNDEGGRHPCHFAYDELELSKALEKKGFKHIPWPVLSVWVRK